MSSEGPDVARGLDALRIAVARALLGEQVLLAGGPQMLLSEAVTGDLERNLCSRAVDLGSFVSLSNRRELFAAAVNGHHLKNIGICVQKFLVKLTDRFRMPDRHLWCKWAGDDIAASFQFDDIASIAEHHAILQSL